MKRNYYTVFICGLFLLCMQNANAQRDTLLLFTKPDCSNCLSVKQVFRQSGISFIEKSLEDNENAKKMLQRLSELGYKDKIYLPVIFLKNKLYHPAYSTNTGLVALALPDVVDSIKKKYMRGELYLVESNQISSSVASNSSTNDSDCEVKTAPIYLICANYSTEKEALEAMNKLISNGYSYAGIAFSQKQYRVYNKFFFDRNTANTELLLAKKIFNNAYLFEMP